MSNMLEYHGYSGSIETSVVDRCFHGKILFITDVVTYEGTTYDDLEAAFRMMVDDYLVTCAEIGKVPQKPFKGSFNVRVSPELHRQAAITAQHENISLNELTFKALNKYINEPNQPPVKYEQHDHHHYECFTQVGTYGNAGEQEWIIKQTQQISH